MLDQHGLNQLYIVNGSMRKVSCLGGCVGATWKQWEVVCCVGPCNIVMGFVGWWGRRVAGNTHGGTGVRRSLDDEIVCGTSRQLRWRAKLWWGPGSMQCSHGLEFCRGQGVIGRKENVTREPYACRQLEVGYM